MSKPTQIGQQPTPQVAQSVPKTVAPQVQPSKPAETTQVAHTAKDFLMSTKDRKHAKRKTTAKTLRHQELVEFVNEFTREFIKGELAENDIKILADAKQYLYEKPGNPFKLKDPSADANAFVQADMKELCITGDVIGGVKIKLDARQVSKNRVAFWNPIVAQEMIQKAPSEQVRAQYKARFDILNGLTPRDGYRSQQ